MPLGATRHAQTEANESSTRAWKLADGGDQIKTLQLPVSLVVTHMKQRGTVYGISTSISRACSLSAPTAMSNAPGCLEENFRVGSETGFWHASLPRR